MPKKNATNAQMNIFLNFFFLFIEGMGFSIFSQQL
jgi:hypothetical protein